MIFDFNVPYQPTNTNDTKVYTQGEVSEKYATFGQRAEIAASHVLRLPEKLVNTVMQIVKAALFAIAAIFTFGQSEFLVGELRLACKRAVINMAGIGTSLIGFFAPVNAMHWQIHCTLHLMGDQADLKKRTIVSALLSV